MNEELQSTNEELETMNDELRERTDEALRANSFLGRSSPAPRASSWSTALRRRPLEPRGGRPLGAPGRRGAGRALLNLDIGLPVDELREPARAALGGQEIESLPVPAHDRRGKPVIASISFAPLLGAGGDPRGAILTMKVEPMEVSA